jgi:NAD(P)-dependent dehydrogenase (short-subunit alcohol dehydrogenase family)
MSVALVTGGARGIGLAIAQRLAADGATVAIADRAGAEEAAAGIASAEAHTADLADPGATAALARTLLERHGRVDVLVNNAAQLGTYGFADVTPEVLRRYLAVNVEAPFELARLLAPAMAAAGRGRIVNVVSNTVWAPPGIGISAYVTSKGALLGMTRALAVELGPSGITVNGVAPGLTRTPGTEEGIPEEVFGMVLAQQPIRRGLVPEDIAAAVAYLVSDAAAAVTGQALRVDGGVVTL